MLELETRQRIFISGNICLEYSVHCALKLFEFCSGHPQVSFQTLH